MVDGLDLQMLNFVTSLLPCIYINLQPFVQHWELQMVKIPMNHRHQMEIYTLLALVLP